MRLQVLTVGVGVRARRAATLAAAVLVFLAYVPTLHAAEYLPQAEYAFYRQEVRPLLRPKQVVWKYQMDPATYLPRAQASAYTKNAFDMPPSREELVRKLEGLNIEFEDWHLFGQEAVDLGLKVTHDFGDVQTGSLIYLGLNCYQFVVGDERMVPECQALLDDPRNQVLKKRSAPVRIFHYEAPWYVSGAYRRFDTVTFYLLRRGPGP